MGETNFKIENLLLIAPFLFLFLLSTLMPNQQIEVVVFNTELILSSVELSFVLGLLTSVPFIFHYLLRKLNKGNQVVLNLHVIVSYIIIIALPIAYYNLPMISKNWRYDEFPLPVYEQWKSLMEIVNFLWELYIILILLFIVYCIVTLNRKNS